eukprot:9468042-Pyramimonas_sp.AAC.1
MTSGGGGGGGGRGGGGGGGVILLRQRRTQKAPPQPDGHRLSEGGLGGHRSSKLLGVAAAGCSAVWYTAACRDLSSSCTAG